MKLLAELSGHVVNFVHGAFRSPEASVVAKRALVNLAHRMLMVNASDLNGELTVKVTYRDGELKNAFVRQDDEAQ